MKMKFTKWAAVCTAAVLGVTGMSVGNVFAATEHTHPYFELYMATGEDRADTVYISESELAEGDVVIPVSIYMDSEEWVDPHIKYMCYAWEPSSWDAIRFQNPMDYGALGENKEYTYSGGTFTSELTPYMLARVITKRTGTVYSNVECMYYSTKYVNEPTFGELIYMGENNQIYFDASYFTSQENKDIQLKEEKRFYVDVEPQEDGSATFTYEYVRQDNFELDTETGTIPFYDPTLPVGSLIPGLCNVTIWQYNGSGTTSFLGESDEFAATSFEAVVQQGTPSGTYTISFQEDGKTFMNEDCLPDVARGLTIVVTEDEPETTTSTTTTTTPETTTTTTTTTSETTAATTTTTTPEPTTTTTTTTTTTEETTTTTTTTETTTTTTTSTTTTTVVSSEVVTVYETPYLSHTSVELYEGMNFKLKVYNADGTETWKTTDESIATISENGTITAKATGSCRVYTIVRGKILFCNVTVVEGLCGDINLDEDVSLIDAVLLNKYLAGALSLNEASLSNADCYDDGQINTLDSVTLLEYLVMLVESLPYTD
ncbi:MAG: hypothetical protein IJ496_05715 [Ruminococcus sp.]|nr:hypothetical protein [Ruminococcus sp.]